MQLLVIKVDFSLLLVVADTYANRGSSFDIHPTLDPDLFIRAACQGDRQAVLVQHELESEAIIGKTLAANQQKARAGIRRSVLGIEEYLGIEYPVLVER